MAEKEAKNTAKNTSQFPPPQHILNAPTKLMKDEGYGKGYIYDHDTPNRFSGQNYFPKELQRQSFYKPTVLGFEKDLQKRMDYFERLRASLKNT